MIILEDSMKTIFPTCVKLFALLAIVGTGSACSPEVGSPEWCADMKEKPKGDWSANEVGDFAKHCVL
jgi:hypothetical protein